MNLEKAIDLLEVTKEDLLSPEKIKKKYHQQALRWHPDKNRSPVSHERFQQIQEAYAFLRHEYEPEPPVQLSFSSILSNFLRILLCNDLLKTILCEILTELNPESVTYQYLKMKCEQLNKQTVIELYQCMWKYRDIFYIRNDILELVQLVIQEKFQNDQVIILHPSLEDMLHHNIYKLFVEDEFYLVPLWHRELYFDSKKEDKEVIVLCQPHLPEGVTIDDDNRIYVEKEVDIGKEWCQPFVSLELGGKTFLIPMNQLHVKKEQLYRFPHQGIAKIKKEIDDVGERSDIVVKVVFK